MATITPVKSFIVSQNNLLSWQITHYNKLECLPQSDTQVSSLANKLYTKQRIDNFHPSLKFDGKAGSQLLVKAPIRDYC